MNNEEKTTAVGKAFEGLALLIDNDVLYGSERDKAEEVLGRIALVLARRPEETLYCTHFGRPIYFPRYGNHACPICKKP